LGSLLNSCFFMWGGNQNGPLQKNK
jgi:hypothetical protein